MDRVTNGDVLDYDMLQLEVGDAKESRKSRLASTLVLGAEYGFLNNKLAVGVLSTTRFVQPEDVYKRQVLSVEIWITLFSWAFTCAKVNKAISSRNSFFMLF